MSDVDVSTRREIDKIVERILRDGGLREPPIQITDVLEHLKLSRDFYRLDDPTLLRRFAHRLQIGTNKLVNIVRDKIKLAAVWLPDEKRILVDTSQPKRSSCGLLFTTRSIRFCHGTGSFSSETLHSR